MRSWLFLLHPPYLAYERWWFAIEGQDRVCHGPFIDEKATGLAQLALFKRYEARARTLRGDVVRLTASRWLVTLPADVPCQGQVFNSLPGAQAG
ncbi:MAG: hypothetical protein ACI9MC_003291 [Kiritimatiellia bacterium]|jgi:hypothetical protein